MAHKEWEKDNSLTTPQDRESNTIKFDQSIPPLTDQETVEAVSELNNSTFVKRFPTVERRFADPAVDNQTIGLVSFVPAKGATPNENGIYGFAKLRGNYPSLDEADARAEFLIRNVDSYHQIYHAYVGRPFPLTTTSDFSKEIRDIDLKQETTKAISDEVKRKREKEQREIEEVKQREQELLADVKKEQEDVDDAYTALRVKKAQLSWTYAETEKKMKQMVGLIAKARRDIELLDAEHPDLKNKYMQKYMDARQKAGLSVTNTTNDESFMKYLVEDLVLPAVDEEYNRLFGDSE